MLSLGVVGRFRGRYIMQWKIFCTVSRLTVDAKQQRVERAEYVEVLGRKYKTDEWTNVTGRILSLTGRSLMRVPNNPLCLLKKRIVDHFYKTYRKTGSTSPLFSFHEDLHPVVTVEENFDSLLVPKDHVSRSKSDTYYINQGHVLRAHTSAHQHSLLSAGLDNFLVAADVYRRDAVDKTHYPAFHQMEGVRLFTADQLFASGRRRLHLFEEGERRDDKQEEHTVDCARMVEYNLKSCVEGLARALFGVGVQLKWVDTYFPFTHPSYELEVWHNDEWLETVGSGIIEQRMLHNAGVGYKVGWAFGLGLERLAMKLYEIPDIRLFWSNDTGFLSQFETDDFNENIKYKAVSKYPQCINDISFWLPGDGSGYAATDFYDVCRSVGGDLVEQVKLFDEFCHPKTKRKSHAYRIVYRHMERVLTKSEVNFVHKAVEEAVKNHLGGEIR